MSALIDGELTAERQAEVIEHVDNCPACARRVGELQRLAAGLGALPKLEPPPQLLPDVHRKLRPIWLKVPVAALAVVAVVVWLTRPRPAAPVRTREVQVRIVSEQQLPETAPALAKVERGDLAGQPALVIVRGESLVSVRFRVTELAQTLNGQAEAAMPSNTFVVRLPAGKVPEFRARLTQKPAPMSALSAAPAVEVKVIVEPTGK